MATKYLNEDVRFKCQNGHAVFFKPVGSVINIKVSGKSALLDDAILSLIGAPRPGQCDLFPDPSTGSPGMCMCAAPLRFNWDTKSSVSVKNNKLLMADASAKCPRQGNVKVYNPTSRIIRVDDEIQAVRAYQSIESGRTAQNSSSVGNDGAHDANNKNADATGCKNEVNESNDTGDMKKNTEYALCNHENCEKKDACEYLNTPHTVAETASGKNANVLRNNIGSDRFDYYAGECSDIETQAYGAKMYTVAHHHIIPAIQCFSKLPELVKLANFYKYDINNAYNGICLPTMEEGYNGQSEEDKHLIAFEAMRCLKRQWHKGNHAFAGKAAEIERISKNTNAAFKSQKPPVDYATAVNALLKNYKSELGNTLTCREKDYIESSKRFCDGMKHISGRIANKLRKFETEPKESKYFFVSALAMLYAFGYEKSDDSGGDGE